MKRFFLVSIMIVGLCALFSASLATSALAAPKGEITYAVSSLGTENFALRQQFGAEINKLVYEAMFRTNWNGIEPLGIYPWLAESYEVSEDGMTFDIYLRKGIQFHEGWGEMTAEDIKFSFDQVKDPANDCPGSYYFAPPDKGGYIKSYEVVSKYHFRVHLAKTYNLFLMDNCDFLYALSKKYIQEVGWKKAMEHPIGTGPYKHVKTVNGDYIKLEAVDNHWRKTPEFKYITLKLVPEISSQIMMLRSGAIDLAMIGPDKISEVKAAGFKILGIPDMRYASVRFGGQLISNGETYDPTVPWAMRTHEPENSEWNNRARKVRKAMCLAINAPAIIDKIFHGYAQPQVMAAITMSHPWYRTAWKPYPYNPAQAKRLLAEAGYAKGFAKPVEVLIPSTPPYAVDSKKYMQAVAADLEAIGIKVERKVMDQMLIMEEWSFQKKSAWRITANVSFYIPHPRWAFPWGMGSQAPFHGHAENPTFDRFIEEAFGTLDQMKIKEAVQGLYDYNYTNYLERGIAGPTALIAYGPKIKRFARLPLQYEHIQAGSAQLNFEYLERAE